MDDCTVELLRFLPSTAESAAAAIWWGATVHGWGTVSASIGTMASKASTVSSTTTATTTSSHSRDVRALGCNLDQTGTEQRLVEDHGVGYRSRVSKLDVSVSLGLSSPLVAKNSDTVDGTTRLEVGLNLLGC